MADLILTGGAGYIGSHVLLSLQNAGHRVVVIDDLRTGDSQFVKGATLYRCDISETSEIENIFKTEGPFDGVLHFAGSTSVAESVKDPSQYYYNNTVSSIGLLNIALAYKTRCFVFSSTAAVYGHPEESPIKETITPSPINPYGSSKWFFEKVLADVGKVHPLKWCALRYFNAAGADSSGSLGDIRFPSTHLIPASLEAAEGLRPKLELFGDDYPTNDGTCIRDYIHVSDLASAHVLALETLLNEGISGCYNLGTGHGSSNKEIIEVVRRVTGKEVPVNVSSRRAGDPANLVADPNLFKNTFGWKPKHSELPEIVETAWAWIKKSHSK